MLYYINVRYFIITSLGVEKEREWQKTRNIVDM